MSIVVEIGKHFLDDFAEYEGVDNDIQNYLQERIEEVNTDFSIVTTDEFWNGDEEGSVSFNKFLIPDDEADRLSKLIGNALREARSGEGSSGQSSLER